MTYLLAGRVAFWVNTFEKYLIRDFVKLVDLCLNVDIFLRDGIEFDREGGNMILNYMLSVTFGAP